MHIFMQPLRYGFTSTLPLYANTNSDLFKCFLEKCLAGTLLNKGVHSATELPINPEPTIVPNTCYTN